MPEVDKYVVSIKEVEELFQLLLERLGGDLPERPEVWQAVWPRFMDLGPL